MRRLISSLALTAILLPLIAPAAVWLHPTPQKFRTFYASDDARIPAHIREQLRAPQRSAQRGTRWRIEADALIRESLPALRLSFAQGLPIGRLRAMAIATDGAVWAGGDEGLVRYQNRPDAWDRWQYFAGRRYLPADEVTAIAAGAAGSVWVHTSAGVSHIEFRPLTLADKAASFERRVLERHKRHGLVADSELREPGNLASSHQYPNDNDGLWTAIYVAAESFRYAVTGDRRALASMRQSVEAMLRLEAITGRSGFPARSFRQRNEPRHGDGIWHFTADGEWEWKADTSSDEIVGHFFAYSIEIGRAH